MYRTEDYVEGTIIYVGVLCSTFGKGNRVDTDGDEMLNNGTE